MSEKVSFIVPAYNAALSIERCLNSICRQVYTDIEILVINDGSTDKTVEIVENIIKTDPRIRLVNKENGGVSSARNTGISEATGEYILFVDSDDEIDENLLSSNIGLLNENNADLLIYGFRYHFIDTNKSEDSMNKNYIRCCNKDEFFYDELINIINHEMLNAPWNKIIRREFLQKNNIVFNCEYSICEDIIFSVDLCKEATKIIVNSKPYYTYYLQKCNSLRTKFHENNFEAALELHRHAMEYCGYFKSCEKQERRFDEMFTSLIIFYIKKIINYDKYSKDEKKKKVLEICNDCEYRKSVKNTRFSLDLVSRLKKNMVRFFILKKCYFCLEKIYLKK